MRRGGLYDIIYLLVALIVIVVLLKVVAGLF